MKLKYVALSIIVCIFLYFGAGSIWTKWREQVNARNQQAQLQMRLQSDLQKYTQQAANGDRDAMWRVAECYWASQDYSIAVEWDRKAATLGQQDAMLRLAEAYRVGTGVPQNSAEALRRLGMIAKLGNPSAVYNIGYYYFNGIGVTANKEEAMAWYAISAEMGFVKAAEKFNQLSGRSTRFSGCGPYQADQVSDDAVTSEKDDDRALETTVWYCRDIPLPRMQVPISYTEIPLSPVRQQAQNNSPQHSPEQALLNDARAAISNTRYQTIPIPLGYLKQLGIKSKEHVKVLDTASDGSVTFLQVSACTDPEYCGQSFLNSIEVWQQVGTKYNILLDDRAETVGMLGTSTVGHRDLVLQSKHLLVVYTFNGTAYKPAQCFEDEDMSGDYVLKPCLST